MVVDSSFWRYHASRFDQLRQHTLDNGDRPLGADYHPGGWNGIEEFGSFRDRVWGRWRLSGGSPHVVEEFKRVASICAAAVGCEVTDTAWVDWLEILRRDGRAFKASELRLTQQVSELRPHPDVEVVAIGLFVPPADHRPDRDAQTVVVEIGEIDDVCAEAARVCSKLADEQFAQEIAQKATAPMPARHWPNLQQRFRSLLTDFNDAHALAADELDSGHYQLSGGPNESTARAALHRQFTALAIRGGIWLGAERDCALDVWIGRLAKESPRSISFSHSGTDYGPSSWEIVPLERIQAPATLENVCREDIEYPAILLERQSNGDLILVAGHDAFITAASSTPQTVRCLVRDAMATVLFDGVSHIVARLILASAEECEQLETEYESTPVIADAADTMSRGSRDDIDREASSAQRACANASVQQKADAQGTRQSTQIPGDLIPLSKAAAICTVTYDTVKKWTEAGVIQCYHVGPSRSLRVSRQEVEAQVRPVTLDFTDSPDSRK